MLFFVYRHSLQERRSWIVRGTSSPRTGCMLTMWPESGVPSVTSWRGRREPCRHKWATCRSRLWQRTRLWSRRRMTCCRNGRRRGLSGWVGVACLGTVLCYGAYLVSATGMMLVFLVLPRQWGVRHNSLSSTNCVWKMMKKQQKLRRMLV